MLPKLPDKKPSPNGSWLNDVLTNPLGTQARQTRFEPTTQAWPPSPDQVVTPTVIQVMRDKDEPTM